MSLDKYVREYFNVMNNKNTNLKLTGGEYVEDTEIYKTEIMKYLKDFSKNKFNDYLEKLAYKYATDIKSFESQNFDIICYYALYKVYPYFIFNIMYNKTISEQLQFIQKLKEIDNNLQIIIQKYNTNIDKLCNYINNYYNNYKSNPITLILNNFIGINFNKINITYDEITDSNYILLHVGYNNNSNNILYNSHTSIKGNFLTDEIMNSISNPEFVKTISTPIVFEIIENNKTIKTIIGADVKDSNDLNNLLNQDNYKIIICYDNDRDYKHCKYSVSSEIYSKREIEILINGGIIRPINTQTNLLYLAKMYYIRKNIMVDVEGIDYNETSETQKLRMKIAKYVKSCYDKNYKKCADNIAKEFSEFPYFREYLEILKYRCDEYGCLKFNEYYEEVKNYLLPEVIC